jgi:hypothetical protein
MNENIWTLSNLYFCYHVLNDSSIHKPMKSIIVLFAFFLMTCSIQAQSLEDKLSSIPKGTVLTLKEEFMIPAYEGLVSVSHSSPNYRDFNLVFTSADKRRIMRKGSQFEVTDVKLEPGAIKILIKEKINWIYFGNIKSRDNLQISELTQVFDVTFPGIDDF